jgi:hypothetical protein
MGKLKGTQPRNTQGPEFRNHAGENTNKLHQKIEDFKKKLHQKIDHFVQHNI